MAELLDLPLPAAAAPAACARLSDAFIPPLRRIDQRDTIRLIPSGRLKAAVLAPLAATAERLDELAALEGATNTRLQASCSGLQGLHPRELSSGRTNDSFLNAAFTHVRPGGNRFNDAGRGAWYCGFDAETALGEVAYHLTRELDAIGRYDNQTDYAEMIADFVGPFHDLTQSRLALPWLGADIAESYPAGQALARRLRALPGGGPGDEPAGSNGLIYPSVRHRGGTCLVAFRPQLVRNLRQGGLWRLRWDGDRTPRVTRHPGAPVREVRRVS